jgi:hypothetical protein
MSQQARKLYGSKMEESCRGHHLRKMLQGNGYRKHAIVAGQGKINVTARNPSALHVHCIPGNVRTEMSKR